MGKGKRVRPTHLGRKLRIVRDRLQLSQNEMLRRLQLDDQFTREELSAYERGVREPPLAVLLKYSEVARIWINVFADDRLELPAKVPSRAMHSGVKRSQTKQR
jgi:transcriptional regulator with XRE-family HTH domain